VAGLALATVVALSGAGAAVYALAAPAGTSPHGPPTGLRASRADAPPALTLRAQPARRTVTPGASATYHVRIGRGPQLLRPTGHRHGRGRLAALVSLRVLKALPPGVTASVRPTATRSTTVVLTLRTRQTLRPGSYRVRLSAGGWLGRATRHRPAHARTSVALAVKPAELSGTFTIGGSLAQLLAPGRVLALDLRLSNPQSHALRIGRLAVRVATVHAPQADATHPCTVGDFAVVAFSGPYGFALRARTTARLSTLGIPERQWPHVAMPDRPVNQDGCKHARLSLSYTGDAVRAHG
jgi:hypothetical protein